ncbi:tetratricopeptide repeat protein [Candidatus Obscuribacterales bacterium]|nr:tetratricopeptide repeat protein [Candidatus Obscuribacterales bacterium]
MKPNLFVLLVALLCFQSGAAASETRSAFDKYLIQADRDRNTEALAMITALSKRDPNNEMYLSERARMLMNLDRYGESIEVATKALKLSPTNASTLRTRSYCYLVQHNYEAGIADLLLAIKHSQPDFVVMWPHNDHDNLARAYSLTGRNDLAKKERELAALDQMTEQAVLARERASLDKSIKICDQVLQKNPKSVNALGFKGLCLNNLSKFNESIEYLSRAIALKPKSVALLYLRADAYRESKQFEKAILDLSKIIELKPQVVMFKFASHTGRLRDTFSHEDIDTITMPDIYYLRGACYVSQKKYDLAIKDFKRTLQLDPKEFKTAASIGNCFFNLKNYNEAIAMYTKAVTINPRYWLGYTARANAYEQVGKLEQAAADYSTILKAHPGDIGARCLRGNVYRKAKAFNKALADFSKVIELAPNDDEGFRNRAEAYAELGKFELALRDYDKALSLSSEDKEQIAKLRAAVLKRMGQKASPGGR